MDKELTYVFNAIKNIDKHYYWVMGFNQTHKIHQQAAENAYTAELYYRLKSTNTEFNDLIWHFDLNKERANSIRPDLVLHKSPDSREDQRIYIEVKTNLLTNDKELSKDVKKLVNAVSPNNWQEKLDFKYAIYVVGNVEQSKIIEKIPNVDTQLLKKIYLIHFNSTDYNPQIKSFYELKIL